MKMTAYSTNGLQVSRTVTGALLAMVMVLATIITAPPAESAGDVRGRIKCIVHSGEVPETICGIGLFQIVTGEPGQNNVTVNYSCAVVAFAGAVATRIAPPDEDGCELVRGPAGGTPSHDWTRVQATPVGVGEPKPTAEIADETDFVSDEGDFAACFTVGAIFASGRTNTVADCGLDPIEREALDAIEEQALGAVGLP